MAVGARQHMMLERRVTLVEQRSERAKVKQLTEEGKLDLEVEREVKENLCRKRAAKKKLESKNDEDKKM